METNSALLLLKKYQGYRYSLKKVFLQVYVLLNHLLSARMNYIQKIKQKHLPHLRLFQLQEILIVFVGNR